MSTMTHDEEINMYMEKIIDSENVSEFHNRMQQGYLYHLSKNNLVHTGRLEQEYKKSDDIDAVNYRKVVEKFYEKYGKGIDTYSFAGYPPGSDIRYDGIGFS